MAEAPIYISNALLGNVAQLAELGPNGEVGPAQEPRKVGVYLVAAYKEGEVAALYSAAKIDAAGGATIIRLSMSLGGSQAYADLDLAWPAGQAPRLVTAAELAGLRAVFVGGLPAAGD